MIDERRSWRPSMHAGHWSRWLPVEAGHHHGFSGGEETQSKSASPIAAFVTALILGVARLPVTGVGRSSGSLHDNSVVHAPLEGGTWPCMRHGAPAEPHANESWTAMHCQAGTVPVSASRLCRLDWPQGHYCDPEEGPLLYAPCQTCLSETAVWGSLAGGSGSLSAGSRQYSSA